MLEVLEAVAVTEGQKSHADMIADGRAKAASGCDGNHLDLIVLQSVVAPAATEIGAAASPPSNRLFNESRLS